MWVTAKFSGRMCSAGDGVIHVVECDKYARLEILASQSSFVASKCFCSARTSAIMCVVAAKRSRNIHVHCNTSMCCVHMYLL